MDWRTYGDAPSVDIEELKAKLPLEWVVSVQAEIPLEQYGEKASGLCPFHEDNDPSLDIYADGQRWGCFPCGRDGDLFDFIGAYWGLATFPAQLEVAQGMLGVYEEEGGVWERISLEEQPVESPEALRVEALSAHAIYSGGTKYPLDQFLKAKQGLSEVNAEWLHKTWHVGVDHDLNIVAPYVDEDGNFVSYKTRYSGSSGWYARKGGRLSSLYGAHQLGADGDWDAEAAVWLFEGETDTWLGSWLLRERGVALGLPTGAGSTIKPEWVDLLRGRSVTLVFDSDRAGRDAARVWHTALVGACAQVKIAWPDAGDLCESLDPRSVIWGGESIPDSMPFVTLSSNGRAYHMLKASGDVGEQISNFVLEPRKRIVDTDIMGKTVRQGLEVSFADDPDSVVRIDDKAFQKQIDMTKWANANGRTWSGVGIKGSQSILSYMLNQTPFLGSERGVEVVGLHGYEGGGTPVFVLPDESGGIIGSAVAAERWRYVPPSTGAADFSRYRIKPVGLPIGEEAWRSWAQGVVAGLMGLNESGVMTVIMAWMCAAVGRSLMREFPPLGVFGGSGTGKTTVMMEVMKTMWGLLEEHNLTSTTPHGVRVWAASTNGIPVWFDEYRRGARKDTMEVMEQILRDAYTASSSSRGGFGDNKQDLHESKASAPIVVSGEESLEEKSHIDRVVSVTLRESAKDPAALRRLQEARGSDDRSGWLGRAYLEWFVSELALGHVPSVVAGVGRREQGENVLAWGWALWRRFNLEVVGLDVGELDLSVVRDVRSSVGEHPISSALEEAIEIGAREPGDRDGMPVAWVVEVGGEGKRSLVAVRKRAFVKWAVNAGYAFPGGEQSTASWLGSRYQKHPVEKVRWGGVIGGSGTQVKVLQLVGVLEEFAVMDAESQGLVDG